MRLQKQSSKKRGDKDYPKFVVVIPKDILSSSGFHEGDILEAEAKKGEIRLRKSRDNNS